MHIYKDTIKSFVITLGVIVVLSLIAFLLGGWILSPRSKESSRATYKPKITYPNGAITLTYWRSVDGREVFDPILTQWKLAHPNVTIQITNIPYAQYSTKLAEAAASGKLPDLFMLRSDWLSRYMSYLSPAPRAVFTTDEYRKTFAPIIAHDLIRNEEIMAVSYGVPTLGLYYNTDMYAKAGIQAPPTSWQGLLDVNARLVSKSGAGIITSGVALGTANISSAASILPLLMMQNGAIMTNTPPTQATFQNPDSTKYASSSRALDFYTSFAKPGKSSYSWSDGFGDSTKAFMAGKTAMIIDYPYRYLAIKSQAPKLNFKMAKIPQVNGQNPINYSEYWAEGVSNKSSYPDVAWDFYNFMTSYEIMNLYSIPTMKPASRLDLAQSQQQNDIIGVFAEQVPTAQSYYKGDGTDSDNAMLAMINTSLAGFDPAIAVRIASEKVTSSIAQYPYR